MSSGSPGEWENAQEDEAADCSGQEDSSRQASPRGKAAKGRAAYAAQDCEMPPPPPRGKGFGAFGGLFTDDAAGPQGHGLNSRQHAESENLLSVVTLEALEEECKKRLCPSCPVKKEAENLALRSLADLENAKKRLAREREEQVRFSSEAVLADILPSLDNIDLALQHAGNHEACRDFIIGVQMTRKLLGDALAKHGLSQIGTVGDEFNPAVHEAVGMVDAPDLPDGHVCSLLSQGYSLNGRLLRPARVVVCKKSV